jgi:hypothetical protein
MKNINQGLAGLIYPRHGESRRESSWDRSGGNFDAVPIDPGSTRDVARINNPGCINHIWMTAFCDDKNYLRTTLLRMYWDGEDQPSVESPLGDFFGVGHARVSHYSSLPMNMVTGTWSLDINAAAMNCFWHMPFQKGAHLEVINESDQPIKSFYYYIDYEAYDDEHTMQDALRFHAQWRRVNPTRGTLDMSTPGVNTETMNAGRNLDGKENYVILKAAGKGHYVGCNLSIDHVNPVTGFSWFGEGDDMIWIDKDATDHSWPPTIHGTGTEDYFCSAWGFPTGQYSFPYHGVSLAGPVKGDAPYSGKWTSYRFHIEDPIIFHERILVTIEHGHNNCHSNDYSSTAYWYQTEPHLKFPAMLPVEARLPIPEKESIKRFFATY